jgi:nucleotide-binding universal stress UspA family protein
VSGEVRADLLLTGRGRHGAVERLVNAEHLLGLLRNGDAPVLAVADALRQRPRRIVCAIDFSTQSRRAARYAISLVDPDALVYLVHVMPDLAFGIAASSGSAHEASTLEALRRAARHLTLPPTVRVQPIILRGQPGAALVEFAETVGADLVVAGARGRGWFTRLLIGSVAAHLVRHVSCSLFICSSRIDQTEPRRGETYTRTLPSAEWDRALSGFTAAHRDRRFLIRTPGSERRHVTGSRVGRLLNVIREGPHCLVELATGGGTRGQRLTDLIGVSTLEDRDGAVAGLCLEHRTGLTVVEAAPLPN